MFTSALSCCREERYPGRPAAVPRESQPLSVADSLSMNHSGMKFSLVSREIIADSVEAVVQGHAYDAIVGFGGLR